MNKQELIKKVATETGNTQKLTGEIVESVLAEIVQGVVQEGKVSLVGFGKFESVERAERKCRNPQTGEEMIVPPTTAVRFKPASGFKEIVKGE